MKVSAITKTRHPETGEPLLSFTVSDLPLHCMMEDIIWTNIRTNKSEDDMLCPIDISGEIVGMEIVVQLLSAIKNGEVYEP